MRWRKQWQSQLGKRRFVFLVTVVLILVAVTEHLIRRPVAQGEVEPVRAMTAEGTSRVRVVKQSSITFPEYPVIATNVAFWEKIYGHYHTRQGVLHDAEDLSLIYDVISLLDGHLPGASRLNSALVKSVRKRYQQALTRLATGALPRSRLEKRVAMLFVGQQDRKAAYAVAKDRVRLQLGQSDRFREGVMRSGAYLIEIKAILKAKGLPEEIAYLPHVESSFNSRAYSRAGAAGLWQFTRGTGRRYMRIDQVVDERYEPLVASRAAAELLATNYAHLKTWPLALTAYNHGRAGMLRAVEKHKTYANIFSFYQSRTFGLASRNFYAEFLAAKKVARRLEALTGLVRSQPKQVIQLRLQGYAAFQDLCKYYDLSASALSLHNPALRRSVRQGEKYVPKGYLLHLPLSNRMARAGKPLPVDLYQARQKQDRFHIVRRGETASEIAKRYQSSVKTLVRLNNLGQQAHVQIGQRLILPGQNRQVGTGQVPTLVATAKQKPRKG